MSDANTAPASPAGSPRQIAFYVSLILVAVLAAAYYRLRADSIFACQPVTSPDEYISYCQSDGYGDFDHGAFWFNLEPVATQSAAKAEVLFVGNSRMEYALSSNAADTWLTQNAPSHYLLGFAFFPRVLFHRAVLKKLNPHARVYIVNIDNFFEEDASAPARSVMQDPQARSHYRNKQFAQRLQRAVCGRVSALCGNSYAILKNRHTGAWDVAGRFQVHSNATYDNPKVDPEVVARETPIGRQFVASLGVDRHCVIFTLVPTVDTPSATSTAIAQALGVDFIAPQVDDLLTFDGSHLDRASAERWSGAFFEAAGDRIRQCLASHVPPTSTAGR
jgi:hypothetical protein